MGKYDMPNVTPEIQTLESEILEKKQKLAELRRSLPKQEIEDYELKSRDGRTLKLSEVFGESNQLILVHNMGKDCPYCTLWADGFNGIRDHLRNRAAFIVVSPDSPDVQKEFAEGRGWKFPMLSCEGSSFAMDLDFHEEGKGYYPGVSAFEKGSDGKIYRTAKAYFGPGDDFCGAWHFFDLLSDGANDWQPRFQY